MSDPNLPKRPHRKNPACLAWGLRLDLDQVRQALVDLGHPDPACEEAGAALADQLELDWCPEGSIYGMRGPGVVLAPALTFDPKVPQVTTDPAQTAILREFARDHFPALELDWFSCWGRNGSK
jgi:hypothetical protein